MMRRRAFPLLWLAACALILAGCATANRTARDQSQMVAKNWFKVIRGAQVFPLNPLREDVKPGDIYIVNQTIETQSNALQKDGYLPLDHKIDTLTVKATAPAMAAIPSFSFVVSRSAGLQANFPVEGIPVGLGLVKSSDVQVSMSIADVTVREVLTKDAYDALRTWNENKAVRDYLKLQARITRTPLFLRTITTVYYTRGVTASIKALDAGGANVAAGGGIFEDASSIDLNRILPEAIKSDAAKNRLVELAAELNKIKPLEVALPGGTATYMKSSDNTVSMNQTFTTPLAVGCVGFDAVIHKNGAIGPPMLFVKSLEDLLVQPVRSEDLKEFTFYRQNRACLSQAGQEKMAADVARITGVDATLAPDDFWREVAFTLNSGVTPETANLVIGTMKDAFTSEGELKCPR